MKPKGGNVVFIVGMGTIGEPLIGLLAQNKRKLGISELICSKATPRAEDRPKIANLVARGVKFAVDEGRREDFVKMGMAPDLGFTEALGKSSVVIDCTPNGNKNKQNFYRYYEDGVLGFIAQGSEHGFGKPYAFNITDSGMKIRQKYIWVVSCNTHNIAVIAWTIGLDQGALDPSNLEVGDFTIFRRATDMSQPSKGFIPSPEVGKHDDPVYGSHQAEDAAILFRESLGIEIPLFSSALKAPTQYMHVMRFSLTLKEPITKEEVLARISRNPLIAVTEKIDTANVFAFGRDHGFFGRIFSQTVIPVKSLTVVGHRVVGCCFTPQDGNSLLSSTAAALYLLHPDSYIERMRHMMKPPFVFKEV